VGQHAGLFGAFKFGVNQQVAGVSGGLLHKQEFSQTRALRVDVEANDVHAKIAVAGRNLDAGDRADAVLFRGISGFGEPGNGVVIGQRKALYARFFEQGDQRVRAQGAVGMMGMGVEIDAHATMARYEE